MCGYQQTPTILGRSFSARASYTLRSIFVLATLVTSLAVATPPVAAENKCLYISSYHVGYAWSDGVERGLRSALGNKCTIKQIDMDTKRNKSPEYIQKTALHAKTIIDSWKPDVVITADDNAARYVIQQHYKDKDIPFVFCGVNWTTEEYGFPYKNVTGIIEVAPIRPLFEQVQALIPQGKNAVYIGANTVTEKKNYARFKRAAEKQSMEIEPLLVQSMQEWIDAYRTAQQYDFIILGSNAGITDWDKQAILEQAKPLSSKLSVTNHEWMMPYAMLGFTKVAEEQGELAGQAAASILDGVDISRIAIIPNRKWDIWTNSNLIGTAGIQLPELLLRKAKQIQ